MEVRGYKETDFERIQRWWKLSGEVAPLADMLPLESTFFVCEDGRDILCFSLYLTNCKRVLWIEAFVGNPDASGPKRQEATKWMVLWIKKYAKRQGYSSLFCMAHNKKLESYYAELGFRKTIEVACLVQEV